MLNAPICPKHSYASRAFQEYFILEMWLDNSAGDPGSGFVGTVLLYSDQEVFNAKLS